MNINAQNQTSAKPNAGCIYDYILGGSHNREIDRQAGEKLKKMIPDISQAMKIQRGSLRKVAINLTQKRGIKVVIDFSSGLPTAEHIHQVAASDTIVIYSDYDPDTVKYAQKILQGTPNVYYFQADTRDPEAFLNRSEVQDILGEQRDIAFVHWGVNAFLTGEDIRHIARYLYNWSGQNSCWAFNAQAADANINDPITKKLHAMYEKMGSPLNIHTLDQCLDYILPWKPDSDVFFSLFDQDEATKSASDHVLSGPGSGYGAYLIK